ncbi:MAG TPA: YdcF family protein [Thermomicrobiales bacterium]|jgi:uncharacterized SAM-binding protein YcdF (DUF218 family)
MSERTGPSRKQIADRYIFLPLARLLVPFLRHYPAKRHLRALARYLAPFNNRCPSDVIVILGGGTPARVRDGARLFRAGLAPNIYLSTDFDPRYAVAATGDGASRQYLLEAGIPGATIVHDRRPRTTRDEANYFLDEAARRGWRSALLVTEPFHLQRATLVFGRAARDRGVDIPIRAIAAGDDHEGEWWHSTSQVAFVLSELASLLAYGLLRRL